MRLQFVDADNPLPGDLMALDRAHRLISAYNPYPGVDLPASFTLEGVARLSATRYTLFSRSATGLLQSDECTASEVSGIIGSVWGGAFIVLP